MAIQLTEIAAQRVQNFLKSRGKGIGLRLGVKTTGCSGMAYVIEYIDGTEVDYQKEGLNEGFQFINPNAKDACGCGESFTV